MHHLSFSLLVHAPPHSHTAISFSCSLCCILSISSMCRIFYSSLHPLSQSPGICIFTSSLSLCIFHSHSFLAYILVISVSFLYSFLSFLFFVPFSPSLRSSLFFCLTLSQSFFSFSAAIFPFELLSSLSFSFPPSHFEAMPMK